MNDAEKARHRRHVNDMLELVEIDMRTGDADEWMARLHGLWSQQDGSFEGAIRWLSKWAAYNTMGLARESGVGSMDDALHAARVLLLQWIDED